MCHIRRRLQCTRTHASNVLSDVFKKNLLIRQQLKASNKKEPPFNAVAEEVTLKVEQIWSTASITSVVSHKRVLKMLQLS